MSYHIYTTDGIILKRRALGEADIVLYVLTYDFGLIIASAKSARVSSSKLRSALQEYSNVSLSCIKAKNGWKITNVVEKSNFYFGFPEYTHKVLAQVSSVLLKMIQGESPNPEVFRTVKSGFEFLKSVEEKNILNFEMLMVLRILKELGYVVTNSDTEIFLSNIEEWGTEIFEKINEKKSVIVEIINKALKESQL